MSSSKIKKVNLALQGGGAHGAYAWGILDKFLEKNLFTIEGISSTSAGSMNAVILAQGMMENGNDGARQALEDFWRAMSECGKMLGLTHKTPLDHLLEPYLKSPMSLYVFNSITNVFSPYQFNPLNYHPIRDVLEKMVDIEKLKHASKIKLFICATNVKTGKIRIFNDEELSIEAILASSCLPKLFQAVQVDNEYYWDGGYLGNPAIFPLIYNTNVPDIIICHLVPLVREAIPTSVAEIDTRLREISFNSSLMREMRAIGFITKLIDNDWIKDEFKDKLSRVYMHCLRADNDLSKFSMESTLIPDWDFLTNLRDLGRQAAEKWLNEHYDFIGKKTTIDFNEWL